MISANPKISVLTCVYNAEKYLRECIESVLSQTLLPFEFAIFNDCSTDNSWKIIQEYAGKFPNLIRPFRHQKNIGMVENGNFARRNFSGNFVTYIDGDDRWLPKMLEMQWKALAASPDARVSYSNVFSIDEAGVRTKIWQNPALPPPPQGNILVPILCRKFFSDEGSLFRNHLMYSHVLNEIGHVDTSLSSYWDWDEKIRLAANYPIVYSGDALVEYRLHKKGFSKNNASIHYRGAIQIYEKYASLINSLTPIDIVRVRICMEKQIVACMTGVEPDKLDPRYKPQIVFSRLMRQVEMIPEPDKSKLITELIPELTYLKNAVSMHTASNDYAKTHIPVIQKSVPATQQESLNQISGTVILQNLMAGLFSDLATYQTPHTDFERWNTPVSEQKKIEIEDETIGQIRNAGIRTNHFDPANAARSTNWIIKNANSLAGALSLLADDYSRDLFLKLLRFGVLGGKHVRLPINNEAYWEMRTHGVMKFLREKKVLQADRWMLDRFEVPFAGQNVNLYTTPGGVCNAFLLKQYAYRRNGIDISAKQDDVVIDGGACWGDTSLYFSALAGESGKVFAFEFVPENRNIIAANAGLNPSFANNICIVPHPLWEKSNEIVKFSARGPSTSMMREISGMISSEVTTISIDDFVAAENHCRVDFIKMDIEGAELSALKGAEKSLRKWKPRLAISLYHKPEDLFEIPLYLNSLNLGYRFYLDHFTIYKEETVLFAIA